MFKLARILKLFAALSSMLKRVLHNLL